MLKIRFFVVCHNCVPLVQPRILLCFHRYKTFKEAWKRKWNWKEEKLVVDGHPRQTPVRTMHHIEVLFQHASVCAELDIDIHLMIRCRVV